MPCHARRVRLFFAARGHAVLGCPVRAAMRGRLVPFQALSSEGHLLACSADSCPRAQQCCGVSPRRNGLPCLRCH